MKLVTVAQMQAIEREANAAGLTYEQMMQNAGIGLAEVVAREYTEYREEGVLGLVGSGNNGGDTLVALTRLANQGWMASAITVRPRPYGDPLVERFTAAGGKLYELDEATDRLDALLRSHAILLDGVLGTGFRLPLKDELAATLGAVQQVLVRLEEPPHVVAVDCPSGVDCDSGAAAPETIPAELTVTMAAIKTGLLNFPAYRLAGEIEVVGIGLPDEGLGLEAWQVVRRFVPDARRVSQSLPERPLDAHKGTFGTALVVAGSVNYTGAALLAGEAAYRIGAGLVTLAVPAPLHGVLAGQLPEATWLLLPHEMGVIAEQAVDLVSKNLERATALLLGPGFGMEKTTEEFLDRLLTGSHRPGRGGFGFVRTAAENAGSAQSKLPPLVIDADGLKLLARLPQWSERLPAPAVLTPHPGEMAVLTGLAKEEIQADRLGVAERFSREWGHVVVLKGAFTVVAAPDGQVAVIPVATPALARAGTGDVLAGLIAGLLAQGVEAFPAAMAGAWIHAQAGMQAAAMLGNTASVLASDVLQTVVEVLSSLE